MEKYLVKKNEILEHESISSASTSVENNFNLISIASNSEVSNTAPSDISKIGDPIFRNSQKMYPKNEKGRSFQSEWFTRFKWLEYSKSEDAVFCYACRQFEPHGSKETVFTVKGFKNWKNALDKSKASLIKHEKSLTHITAMSKWVEKEHRTEIGKTISTVVNDSVLERNRYYVRSVIEIIQFLAVNELASRGTYNLAEHEEKSLLKNLFEFTLRKDEKLKECYRQVPKNAFYLSPEIQNELIKLLAETVREDIIEDVKSADVPFFSILEDGTWDRNHRENIAIGIRYVKDGKVFESILKIETSLTLSMHQHLLVK